MREKRVSIFCEDSYLYCSKESSLWEILALVDRKWRIAINASIICRLISIAISEERTVDVSSSDRTKQFLAGNLFRIPSYCFI